MLKFFKDRRDNYKTILMNMSRNISDQPYDSKCMFVIALYQYIESLFMIQYWREGVAYETEDIKKYVNNRHRKVSKSFDILTSVYEQINAGCYMDDCVSDVKEFIDNGDFKPICEEFEIDYKSFNVPSMLEAATKIMESGGTLNVQDKSSV